MAEDLKPCPLCGGKAAVEFLLNGYFVECGKCGLAIATRPTEEDAVEFWNRRNDSLKPCPFCGGAGIMKHLEPFPKDKKPYMYRVACGVCHASTRYHRTEAEAAAAWNGVEEKEL